MPVMPHASLRDTARYPNFSNLTDYPDGYHRILLGETTSVGFTVLRCKDKVGKPFTVAFYPDENAHMPKQLNGVKEGSTVAIKNATWRDFPDGTQGVRQKDFGRRDLAENFYIFRVPLTRTIELADKIIARITSTSTDAKRICAACGEEGDGFQLCGRCKFAFYCSKDCQKTDWDTKCHKKECLVYADLPKFMKFVSGSDDALYA